MKNEKIIREMTLEEKASLTSGKGFFESKEIKRLDIPSIYFSDGPHGLRRQQDEFADHLGLHPSKPATCFPTAATIASSWDVELGKEIGHALGEECLSLKVNVLLGPGLNIKRNPRCGRNFEYFSEDPYLAGKLASSYINGIQENGVSGCLKHFACNNQEERRMTNDSVMDERTLREIYLTGFEIAVKESSPKCIMSSYNMLNGTHTNENKHLLLDILRNEWKYDGVVVTDWGGENDRILGLEAGNSIEMPGCKDTINEVIDAVKTGKLSEDLLDRNIDRSITLALETAKPFANKQEPIDVEKHHKLAERAANESMVLLKNHHDILPLQKGSKVAIIGDFAEKPRYQGAGSSVVIPTKLDTTLDIIKEYPELNVIGYEKGFERYGKKSKSLVKKACELASKADIVLLYLGLDELSEAEGIDRKNINFPDNQVELVNQLAHNGSTIIAIVSAGSQVKLNWTDEVEGLLMGYLGGQAGARAILNIVTGRVNPCGKLAESFPLKYHDCASKNYFPGKEKTSEYREGIFVGYRYYDTEALNVKYPFGFGLSYTSFAYSNYKVDKDGVSFTITNTGKVSGKEIAQLYISGVNTKIFRPKKELKGFIKVNLEPGESKNVSIKFDEYTFRYFNVLTNKFEVEGAVYDIMIGSSSNDIQLSQSMTVEGTTTKNPYKQADLPSYYSAKVENVSDKEFEILLGRKIPKTTFDFLENNRMEVGYNTTVAELRYARGWTGRVFSFAIRRLISILRKVGKRTLSNEIIMGVLNQPMRGISRLTGGALTWEELNGLILMFNGHFHKGLIKYFKAHHQHKIENKMEKRMKKEEKAQQEATKVEENVDVVETKKESKKHNKFVQFFVNIATWYMSHWNKFKGKHPKGAKLLYQMWMFWVFSMMVTVYQFVIFQFLPGAFGPELAATDWLFPRVQLTLFDYSYTWSLLGTEVVKDAAGNVLIGGGLGYFLSYVIGTFTAQIINFPLQRNITFKSKGNPYYQAMWYFIAWVVITLICNGFNNLWVPLFKNALVGYDFIANIIITVITGGVSMVIFFFVYKIIFPEANKGKQK